MDDRDQWAIEELFAKLSNVEDRAGPRDPEAERYIAQQIRAQPGAPYYMAQTIIVQEQALAAAEQRIRELEVASSSSRAGPFSGVFGGDRARQSSGLRDDARSAAGPWGSAPRYGGGGFLAGAAQTAMGVAGGVLLGNMIGDFFAGDEASDNAEVADAGDQNAGDFGGDEGDFGDFDMG